MKNSLSNISPNPSTPKKLDCFVLSPVGKDNSDERVHADKVFNFLLKPVLERRNYKIERADKINVSGIITNQIIEKIVKSDLIIAILTYDNPNVFYELALCHVARKPFIQMIEKNKDIPFDTSQVRTIYYALDDIATFQETIDKLDVLINKKLDDADNPISIGLDALTLKESKEPEKEIKAQILGTLQGIDNKLDNNLRMIQNQLVRLASQGQSFSMPQSIDSFNKVKGNVISLQDFWTYQEELKKKDHQEISNAKKKTDDKIEYI